MTGSLKGHTHFVTAIATSPDGRYVISGSEDCTLRIWDTTTGQTVTGPLEGHTGLRSGLLQFHIMEDILSQAQMIGQFSFGLLRLGRLL